MEPGLAIGASSHFYLKYEKIGNFARLAPSQVVGFPTRNWEVPGLNPDWEHVFLSDFFFDFSFSIFFAGIHSLSKIDPFRSDLHRFHSKLAVLHNHAPIS